MAETHLRRHGYRPHDCLRIEVISAKFCQRDSFFVTIRIYTTCLLTSLGIAPSYGLICVCVCALKKYLHFAFDVGCHCNPMVV